MKPRPRFKRAVFPKDWIPAVKCPTCHATVTGYYVREIPGFITTKYLVPCMHQMTTMDEAHIVNDMMKRGI